MYTITQRKEKRSFIFLKFGVVYAYIFSVVLLYEHRRLFIFEEQPFRNKHKGGLVAQWFTTWPADSKVRGSTLTLDEFFVRPISVSPTYTE